MKSLCSLLALSLILLVAPISQAELPAKIPRVLLVGDSWTGFMWGFRSFEGVFESTPGLENYVEVGSRTAVMGARAFEFYPDVFNYVQAIRDELMRCPTIDVVVMTLGGNDFLRGTPSLSSWNCGMLSNPSQEENLINSIATDIEGIVDIILSVRPDIRVAICGYTYAGRDRGGCSICDQQNGFVRFEAAKKDIADRKDRVYYVHNFGLMQHHFGTVSQPAGVIPLPSGFPDYNPFPGGDPCQLVNPIALFDQDIHLSKDGYAILAQRCVTEFVGKWLDFPKVFEIRQTQTTMPALEFQVTFSKPVTGVDLSDFLASVSTTKADLPVTGVVPADAEGRVYTVAVDGTGATGTVQLRLIDDDSIKDAGDVPLGGAGTGAQEGNGDFSANGVLSFQELPKTAPQDFLGAFNFLDANADPYYVLLHEQGVYETFDASDCDLNGPFNIDPIIIEGNGMLDSLELALITECYDNPQIDFRATGGIWHDRVVQAYDKNFERMAADCGGPESVLNTVLFGVPQIFAGFMTLGDEASIGLPIMASAAAGQIDPNWPIVVHQVMTKNYDLLPEFFGSEGDADGDGYTNKQEYLFFVKSKNSYEENRAAYLAAALDPDLFPGSEGCLECRPNTSGLYEVGSDLCLTPSGNISPTSLFQWSKVGGNLDERVDNTNCRWLRLFNVQESDSGTYECVYDDGSKASAFYSVNILVRESVPVAGPIGLLLLTAACGGLGAMMQRRKR